MKLVGTLSKALGRGWGGHTILSATQRAVSVCEDREEERKMTPFTPLPGRKLHAARKRGLFTPPQSAAPTRSYPELGKVTMTTQNMQGFQTPRRRVQAKHCWAHPRWGWARSQLLFSLQMFLVVWPRERGREWRGLHNFPSSRTSNPVSACAGRGGLPWKWRRKNWIECGQK